jgi:hypothetical protein
VELAVPSYKSSVSINLQKSKTPVETSRVKGMKISNK